MEQSFLQQSQHSNHKNNQNSNQDTVRDVDKAADKELSGFDFQQSHRSEKERTGISQFAEVNKVKNAIDISFGGKNYSKQAPIKDPANIKLDFGVGDKVRQMKYGVGIVKEIRSAGADYEVTVSFENAGEKKIMANLSKLKKAKA